MPKECFYLTTPIYYVNAAPHIGHAYTTICADVISRYYKLTGRETFFLTGTDEHGAKIAQSAQKYGKTPQEFCDLISQKYKEAWKKLNINYDYFIRTTEERHKKALIKFIESLNASGKIYKGKYQGLYCLGCEKFIIQGELHSGLCPDHKTKPELIEEENYFFKLSDYQKTLINLIENNILEIQPEIRKNEVLGKLKSGLEDISISRANLSWGIPLPFDLSQTIYVWVDALTNYISAIGYEDDPEKFNKLWPADLHLIGKDILWFHCVIWPALLLAGGLPLPKKIFVHGFFTLSGEKMSKTLGNVMDPIDLTDQLGEDVLRYFLLREATFGLDFNFSQEAVKRRLNNDLANDLGNLLSRTLTMIKKYFDGSLEAYLNFQEEILKNLALETIKNYQEFMENLKFKEALEEIWKLIARANKYIEEKAPWKMYKEKEILKIQEVLYNLAESLKITALLIFPFMPKSAKNIWEQLGFEEKIEDLKITELKWGKTGKIKINPKGILFPKI
ncbi:MAG: methionine--tRNA ligase [Armatimonadetes bacterium]|nr:methionine--tRNA ligase [Armatimonadota bacterium]